MTFFMHYLNIMEVIYMAALKSIVYTKCQVFWVEAVV